MPPSVWLSGFTLEVRGSPFRKKGVLEEQDWCRSGQDHYKWPQVAKWRMGSMYIFWSFGSCVRLPRTDSWHLNRGPWWDLFIEVSEDRFSLSNQWEASLAWLSCSLLCMRGAVADYVFCRCQGWGRLGCRCPEVKFTKSQAEWRYNVNYRRQVAAVSVQVLWAQYGRFSANFLPNSSHIREYHVGPGQMTGSCTYS